MAKVTIITGGASTEIIQDSIGSILVDSSSVDFTYDDAANTITATVLAAAVDHGSLAGLTDDDHAQYGLLAGRAGGQVLRGGSAASEKLVLESTANATKSTVDVRDPIRFKLSAHTNFMQLEPSADAAATITIPSSTDTLVNLTGSQTLTNKTLTAPVIADFTSAAHDHQDADDGGQLDHGAALTGLTDDDHTIYALLAGRGSSQTLIGAADSAGTLVLRGTAHSTKGHVIVGDDWSGNGNEKGLIVGASAYQGGLTGDVLHVYRSDSTYGTSVRIINPLDAQCAQLNMATGTGGNVWYMNMYACGTGYAASGGRKADALNIISNGAANGQVLLTLDAAPIALRTGGATTDSFRVAGTGQVLIGAEALESSEWFSIQKSQNATTAGLIYNATNGANAQAEWEVVSESGGARKAGVFSATCASWSDPTYAREASSVYLSAGETVTNGLAFHCHGASPQKWFINSAIRMTLSTGGALQIEAPKITAGSGTGVTVNDQGSVARQIYKVTVTFAALAAAATTADKTIATLPAKTRLVGIIADTTTQYTGGGVTAATIIVGKSVGGNEYVVSHDVFTAPITRGLADADLGTSINRASAIQGGDLPSWTGTTNVSVRLTTVTANTDQLTAGSTTYYLVCEKYP